jgi:predicted PurR-regulated permease PerM
VGQVAQRAAVATIVVVAVVALALAVWKLRLVVALLFLAFILAAALRPGIEALARKGVPRAAGIALHYLAILAVVGGLLWLAVPRAVDQIDRALAPQTQTELRQEAQQSTGVKHEVLQAVQRRLDELPSGAALLDPAVELTMVAFEVVLGIFFVLASAAYWIFERERAEGLLCSLLPTQQAQRVRDTWNLIDLKLGAYVRGQALLILLVGGVLSVVFWAIGLPYWLLVGAFAGIVELVPVIGPLAAGGLAVTVGLTASVGVAVAAAVAVAAVRIAEDYLVIPRVLGDAVGLTPLVVLVSVTACGLLFGGFAVVLAIPFAAVVATLIDVIVRDKDPAQEEVPTVLFPAKDAETG